MAELKSPDIKVYTVWVPILPSDVKLTVGRATKNLDEPRVKHYWDANNVLTQTYSPVLGIEDKTWDVYLLYPKDAEWNDKPPKPIYWQEQLGISEETTLDRVKLGAEINKLLAGESK